MTLCRKCGKEILAGEELCQECQNMDKNLSEAYLEELMQSMAKEFNERDFEEPVAEESISDFDVEELILEDAVPNEEMMHTQDLSLGEDFALPEDMPLGEELALTEDMPLGEELALTEDMPLEEELALTEDMPLEEELALTEDMPLEEELMLTEDMPMEEELALTEDMPLEEELVLTEDMPMEEEPVLTEDMPMEEELVLSEDMPLEEGTLDGEQDVNELLKLLSQDYEEMPEVEEPIPQEVVMEAADETPIEASLFSEDDDGGIFADELDSLSIDDMFDDALSAVEDIEEEEPLEEFVTFEESSVNEELDHGESVEADGLESLFFDSLSLDESNITDLGDDEKRFHRKNEEKKNTIWTRLFANIIMEQSAEEEEKEREYEQASAEKKAALKAEKKKAAAVKKAEKAEQAKVEKEKKVEDKKKKAAFKEAQKEQKKREREEEAANEVVGKINPIGASIVMAFFCIIGVATVFGSQVFSRLSSVHGAESAFEERDYKDAYESLAGVPVEAESDDFETKDKIRICMQIQRQLDAFENYYDMKMYLEALDSLMKGIHSYDINQSKAERYDVTNQMNELEVKVAEKLYQEFGVSESQARSINSIEDRMEYTSRLETIISQWEARIREDER